MFLYTSILIICCAVTLLTANVSSSYKLSIGGTKFRFNVDKIGFFIVFFVLSFFSVIRDNCGCDYESYIIHILRIQKGLPDYTEIGFQKIVLFLSHFNDNPRLVISLFGILTCFFYVKSIWNQSDDKLLSVFIFLSWGYYFLTFNTIRNYFALSIVLYSIKFIINEKNKKFIFFVVLASLFHKSALICIPLYFLAKKDFNYKHYIFFLFLTFIFIVFKGFFRNIIFNIYPDYLNSVYDTGRVSFLNIFKSLVIILLYAASIKAMKNDKISKFYFNLNVFSLMLYIGFYWLPEISRIGFYLNASSILLIPRILNTYVPRESRKLKIIFSFFSIVLFFLLLKSFSSNTIRLLPYKTWLIDHTYNSY